MFIKKFAEISKSDTQIAGGKGASLGEMTQVGLPVPPGFVVLAQAFDKFLEETDLDVEIDAILHKVNTKEVHTFENASEEIHALILNAEMPEDLKKEIEAAFSDLNTEYVAVRSSATAEDSSAAAWAGQLESYLNTTEKDLIGNIKQCWASLFTPRAIFYRIEKELHNQKISVAVVIQKMVESEMSGIVFSVHPVTEDRNQLIIEAGFGLGEAIVSGAITPDAYVVEKEPRRIIDTNINIQTKKLVKAKNKGNEWVELSKEEGGLQVLSEKQILELAELIIKIEHHYNAPQDVEWAYQGGRFYIVQSRPITTLPEYGFNEKSIALQLINKYKFSKYFVYPFLPVISFESANYWYVNNPLKNKLGIDTFPVSIVILKDGYEEWGSDHIQKITEVDKIDLIIDENKKIVEKYEDRVGIFLRLEYKKLSNKEVIDVLKELNQILTQVYYRYVYLIHDYIETTDSQLVKILPEVRVEMSDFVEKVYGICDNIIEALSERFVDIDWRTFVYATFEEIIDLLKNPDKVEDFKKINKRCISFAFDGKTVSVVKGDEVNEILDRLNDQKEKIRKDIDSFEGRTAFPGHACGTVVVISEYEYGVLKNRLKDKKDYILVAPMTRPEFVSYMKNCKAIITDEGGITCHAAIVSRELKIPCVVGTKIATHVLKDGDLVDVDADNAVVHIVEKNKN